MKVLHISPKPVYPQVDGGCTAMANFLELLSETFEKVEHICIATPKHPFFETEYRDNLPSNVTFLKYFNTDTTVSKRKFVFSLGQKTPYQTARFFNAEMADFLKQIAVNYDAVFLESAFLSPYLEVLKRAKKVFIRTHNAEFKIWETKEKTAGNWFKKILFNLLANQMKQYEKIHLEQASGLIHISEKDEQIFRKLLPNTSQLTISLALNDIDFTAPKEDFQYQEMGFLGAMNWEPNQKAIEALQKTIFPALQRKFPLSKLFIAGFGTDKLISTNSHCVILGTVAALDDFYTQISVFLAPLESGSGLKIKAVQAISKGKMVIGSEIAFEGLSFLPFKRIVSNLEDYILELEKIKENPRVAIDHIKKQQEALKNNFGKQVLISKLKQFVH